MERGIVVFAEIFASLVPLVALFATVTMVVLRAGASRIFFDVVGSFQATRLIGDAQAKITVLQSLVLDGLSGITEGVGLIGEQFNQLVDSTVPLAQEIGYARIEFEKFLQEGENVAQLTEDIIKLGTSYGFSGDQALAAGAKMAQLSSLVGGGDAITGATEVGIAFGLVGGMETEEAMKRLVNLQQQTTFMYGDLTQAQYKTLSSQKQLNLVRQESVKMLNQLNTIENRSSATMAQVTHVMNQFASSAKLAGDDISYMAAASATLIEAGEEQGKAGRALKMIYARLGADTGKNSEILNKFGIQTKDVVTGGLRPLEDILTDIAAIYPRLASEERLQIAQAMAGNDHYVRAIKLMDNYSRTMDLQSMAIGELDTAQEELNKRFKDNSFLLTKSEADLKNAKAALGDQFTPAVIEATNAQAQLYYAFADTIGGAKNLHPALDGLIDGLFQLTQVGRTFAPFVEANLNIMSLNVSLQTQMQIQRALTGQDIVRASAYGSQGSQLRANLGTISNTASLEDARALTAASLLRLGAQEGKNKQVLMRLSGTQSVLTKAELNQKKQSLHTEIGELQVKQRNSEVQSQLVTKEHQMMNFNNMLLDQEIAILNTKKAEIPLLTEGQAIMALAQKQKGYELKTETALLAMKATHPMRAAALSQHQASLNEKKKAEHDIEIQIQQIKQRKITLASGLSKTEQQHLKSLQSELKLTNQLIQEEGVRLINRHMTSKTIQGEAQASQILRDAHIKIIAATHQKSNTETQNNAIMQAAEQAARELAMAYGINEAALREVIPTLNIFAAGLDKVAAQSKQTVNSSMALNNTMMKFAGTLGGLSMVFGMFGDDAKAARLSMLLLNASMVPMMFQMFKSTSASYGLMTGFTAAGLAADKAAVSVSRLNKALKLSVIGIAITGLSYIAYKLMPDATRETEDLEVGLANLSATATYASDSYKNLSESLALTNLSDISKMRVNSEERIARLNEEMANTTEPALLAIKRDQLDITQEELNTLLQIQAVRQAAELRNDGSKGSQFYQRVKEAQKAEQAYNDAIDKQNTLGGRANEMAEVPLQLAIEGIGGAFGYDYKTQKEKTADLKKVMENAFGSIPEELDGALVDAARIAKNEAEFFEILEKDFREFDKEGSGGLFGGTKKAIEDNFIGPIEAAKEAAFEFSNAREEMFFGMAKGNITGDMVKQVVNKGVETLINTTEVVMTNNFTGMTTTQAANEITKQVVSQLNGLGMNLSA